MKDEIVEMTGIAIGMFILAAVIMAFEILFGTVSWLGSAIFPDVDPILRTVATTFLLLAIIIIVLMIMASNKKWK